MFVSCRDLYCISTLLVVSCVVSSRLSSPQPCHFSQKVPKAGLPSFPRTSTPHLSTLTMHKQPPACNRLARLIRQLLPRALLQPTKHKLRFQLPVGRDIPDLRGLLVRQRVVVLEVGAEAFGFESCPGCELVHGGGVFGPLGELVGVEGDFVLQRFDGVAGFVEEDLLGKRKGQSICWERT